MKQAKEFVRKEKEKADREDYEDWKKLSLKRFAVLDKLQEGIRQIIGNSIKKDKTGKNKLERDLAKLAEGNKEYDDHDFLSTHENYSE